MLRLAKFPTITHPRETIFSLQYSQTGVKITLLRGNFLHSWESNVAEFLENTDMICQWISLLKDWTQIGDWGSIIGGYLRNTSSLLSNRGHSCVILVSAQKRPQIRNYYMSGLTICATKIASPISIPERRRSMKITCKRKVPIWATLFLSLLFVIF